MCSANSQQQQVTQKKGSLAGVNDTPFISSQLCPAMCPTARFAVDTIPCKPQGRYRRYRCRYQEFSINLDVVVFFLSQFGSLISKKKIPVREFGFSAFRQKEDPHHGQTSLLGPQHQRLGFQLPDHQITPEVTRRVGEKEPLNHSLVDGQRDFTLLKTQPEAQLPHSLPQAVTAACDVPPPTHR